MVDRINPEHRIKNLMQFQHIERDTVDGNTYDHRQMLTQHGNNNIIKLGLDINK